MIIMLRRPDPGPVTERVAAARALLAPCRACAFDCDVDRCAGRVGRCKVVAVNALVDVLLGFQRAGPATVTLITPTHYGRQVVELLIAARAAGLTLPVVFNCGGYEALPMLRLLEGLVDIYLPDVKTF